MRRLWTVLVVLAAVCVTQGETIDPADYANAVRIRFDGHTQSTPLTNFPAVLTFTDGEKGFRYSDMESDDYSDLRFAQADGTSSIPYEVEAWKSAAPTATQPTNIAGCLLWLKADAGAQTNALGGVTNWLDQSGNGNHAASQAAATHPGYVTNVVNGQPVVRFSGADDNYIKFTRFANIRTVFWVIKEDADAADSARFLLGDQGGGTYDFHRGGGKTIWNSSHAPMMFNGTTELNGTEINGRTTVMPTSMSVLSVRTTGNARANSLSRDRNINGRSWDGDVAELIIYDRELAASEMVGIYLYLEAKYGIDIAVDTAAATVSHVWVQVPVLTNNTTIYAYWGNPADTALPVYSTNGATWSEGFGGVWHMDDANPPDSTTNGNNGTGYGTPTVLPALVADGVDAVDSGEEDDIRVDDDDSIDPGDNFTASLWVKTSMGGAWFRNVMGNFGVGGGGGTFWGLGWMGANDLGFVARVANQTTQLHGGAYNDGRWHHLVGQKEGDTIRFYVDGALKQSGTRAGGVANNEQLWFCNHGNYGTGVDGAIDEARVSPVVRTPDWIRASYDNQFNPAAFATVELDAFWDTSTAAGLQDGDGAWSTADANWSASTFGSDPLKMWESGATARFTASGTSVVSVATVTAHAMIVDGSGYSFTGGPLTLDRGGVAANASLAVGSSVSLADAQEWTVATGKTMTVSGTVDNGGNRLTVLGEGDAALAGVVSGAGGLTKDGTGTLLIDAYDTYTGGTLVNTGTLQLNKGGNVGALRGNLTIASDGQVDLTIDNALGWGVDRVTTLNINGGLLNNAAAGDNGWAITINLDGGELRSNGGVADGSTLQLFSLGGGSTIRTLAGTNTAVVSGRVNLRENNAGNSLPFDVADSGVATGLLVTAVITEQGGARAITKTGGGVMVVTGDNLYTGGTTIDNGTLLVNNTAGSGVGSGAVAIDGGTLGGTGTVGASVSMGAGGGFVSPGASVGALRIEGDLDLTSAGGAGLYVEIDATNAYDVLTVTGLVTLGESMLVGEVGYAPGSNDTFFILVNEGTEAINGTFGGIAQGDTVELDGTAFNVSYEGDSETKALTGGNDVVLYNGATPGGPGGDEAPYWMQIAFAGYTRSTPLTNFPALVLLREDMDDFSFGGFLSGSGDDLRFFDGTNTGKSELNFEIEAWDTNGEAFVWVQVPVLTNGVTIWAYWGDTNMTAQPAYTTNGATWESAFAGVWHLHGTNAVGNLADSTPGEHDGQNSGTVSVAGQVGDAQDWPGDNFITISPDALSGVSTQVTVSLWTHGAASQPRQQDTFSAMVGANRVIQAHLPWSNGNVYWDAGLAGTAYDRINKGAVANMYKGRWNLWSFTKNTATGSMKIYVNGEFWHSGTGATRSMAGADAFRLGGQASGGLTFRGSIDEFRVSSRERPADWIWACYQNQIDPAGFVGIPNEASYWDTSPALGIQGGDGTWDSGAAASWSEDGLLGSSPLLTWDSSNDAQFTAPGPATVTVANGVVAERLVIGADGYTFSGGPLTLHNGIEARGSATISTPVTVSRRQAWYVAAGETLTISGAGWNLADTLVKRGAGTLTFQGHKYSYCSAELDIIVEEGQVRFNSNYDWSTRAMDDMRIHVKAGASLYSNAGAFGGVVQTHQGALQQVLVDEGATWTISNYRAWIQNNTYGGQGRVVLTGVQLENKIIRRRANHAGQCQKKHLHIIRRSPG